jgi:UDPglucose 6-dehydrogenase
MRKNKPGERKVCVIGLWHLGLVTAAALSEMGNNVIGTDINTDVVTDIENGKLPVYEPGLEELISSERASSRLTFSADLMSSVKKANTIFIAYDTPVDENDQADLTIIEKSIVTILPWLQQNALVVINSQVPIGCCERWRHLFKARRPDDNVELIYQPENLRLGQSLSIFRNPDFLVIGHEGNVARKRATDFYNDFTCEKFFVSLRTSEMAKHTLNSFFATSISFANEIGNLCDAVGADGLVVSNILKKDSRIGKKAQVRPGLGFAGATLARDLKSLQIAGTQAHVPTSLIDTVFDINVRQVDVVANFVEQHLGQGLPGLTISIFGLTYKAGTSTLRRSLSIELIKRFRRQGIRIKAHDPQAAIGKYPKTVDFEFSRNPYKTVEESNGIVLLTDWPEYRKLNFDRIKDLMAHPTIIDARNFLNRDELKALGFKYIEIGRGQFFETSIPCA